MILRLLRLPNNMSVPNRALRVDNHSPASPNTSGAPVQFALGSVVFKAARVKLLSKVETEINGEPMAEFIEMNSTQVTAVTRFAVLVIIMTV